MKRAWNLREQHRSLEIYGNGIYYWSAPGHASECCAEVPVEILCWTRTALAHERKAFSLLLLFKCKCLALLGISCLTIFTTTIGPSSKYFGKIVPH